MVPKKCSLYDGWRMGLHETPSMGERAGGAHETLCPCAYLEGATKGTKCLPPGAAWILWGFAPSVRGQEQPWSWVLLTPMEVVLPLHLAPAGLGRVSFVGRSVFLHVWFWIKTVLLKWFVGSFPLAAVWLTLPSSQDCTTQSLLERGDLQEEVPSQQSTHPNPRPRKTQAKVHNLNINPVDAESAAWAIYLHRPFALAVHLQM